MSDSVNDVERLRSRLEQALQEAHNWRTEAYDYAHQIVGLRRRVERLEAELQVAQGQARLRALKQSDEPCLFHDNCVGAPRNARCGPCERRSEMP